MTTDWRNMPGPGDPETWGPCTGHPNDPRTQDDTERVERVTAEIIDKRMNDVSWFREALAEADDDDIKHIMDLFISEHPGITGALRVKILVCLGIVQEYVIPNDWEVQEQIEMEDEPDDRV